MTDVVNTVRPPQLVYNTGHWT